jgi:hypothetical protein
LFILLLVLFKGSIYRACVSYKITGRRQVSYKITAEKDEYRPFEINAGIAGSENENEIIEPVLDTTAGLLSFTTGKCATDHFLLRHGGKTNCIGYADVCNFIFETELSKRKNSGLISGTYIAQLYIFGYNIHHLFNNPFWKDHDVVVITNTTTGKRTLLDPTLYDYTGVGIVRERK